MGLRNVSNKRFELKKYSAVSLSHKLIDKNIFPIINIDKSFENVLNYQIKSLKPDKLLIREPIYDNEIKILNKIENSFKSLEIVKIPLQGLINHKEFIESYGFPETFSKFRKIVEKNNLILNPIDTKKNFIDFKVRSNLNKEYERIVDIEKFSIKDFINYLKKHVKSYKETRDQIHGQNISSQLSVPLSLGILSPRRIVKLINEYEKNVLSNQSTYWLKFELLWREYFKLLGFYHGSRIFNPKGISQNENVIQHPEVYDWSKLEFKDDLVFSINEQLVKTGYITNRARQIFASYFINNLKLSWLSGARYFKSYLMDYDTETNYGNWMYIAGVGTDPRGGRVFNLEKQKNVYDPNMEYRKKWQI